MTVSRSIILLAGNHVAVTGSERSAPGAARKQAGSVGVDALPHALPAITTCAGTHIDTFICTAQWHKHGFPACSRAEQLGAHQGRQPKMTTARRRRRVTRQTGEATIEESPLSMTIPNDSDIRVLIG